MPVQPVGQTQAVIGPPQRQRAGVRGSAARRILDDDRAVEIEREERMLSLTPRVHLPVPTVRLPTPTICTRRPLLQALRGQQRE